MPANLHNSLGISLEWNIPSLSNFTWSQAWDIPSVFLEKNVSLRIKPFPKRPNLTKM